MDQGVMYVVVDFVVVVALLVAMFVKADRQPSGLDPEYEDSQGNLSLVKLRRAEKIDEIVRGVR